MQEHFLILHLLLHIYIHNIVKRKMRKQNQEHRWSKGCNRNIGFPYTAPKLKPESLEKELHPSIACITNTFFQSLTFLLHKNILLIFCSIFTVWLSEMRTNVEFFTCIFFQIFLCSTAKRHKLRLQ